MSTLKTGALRGTSGTADSIQLHASNQSVTFPGAVTMGNASGSTGLGKILNYTWLTTYTQHTAGSSNSTWNVNTDIQPTITPSATSSKIIVYINGSGILRNTSNCGMRLEREIGGNGTWTHQRDHWYENSADVWSPINWTMMHLDSPSTTSECKYRMSLYAVQNPGNCRWAYDAGAGLTSGSSIILFELGA